MTLTPLHDPGTLPGLDAESFTVTDGDELLGWIVRHPHAVSGSTGWRAVRPDGSVACRDESHKRDAIAALSARGTTSP